MKNTSLLLGFLTLVVSSAACSTVQDSSEESSSSVAESSLATVTSELVGTCASSTGVAAQRQHQAEGIYQYIVGNNSKTPTDATLKGYADFIRGNVVPWSQGYFNGQKTNNIVMPTTGDPVVICGVKASLYRFNCLDLSNNPVSCPSVAIDAFNNLANRAEVVYPNIRPFLHTVGSTYIEFDPSTARATAALSGSNGAAASARFTSDNVATTIRKWPGSQSSCSSNCPAIGTPCSTSDLPVNGETSKQIAANPLAPNYLKCW